MFPSQMVRLKIVEQLKWPTFSMFPSQMVYFKIVEPLGGPLTKWYVLKVSNPQVAHFFHVSLANGMP